MRSIAAVAFIALTACATQQPITLLPRAPGGQKATGTVDIEAKRMTAQIAGRKFEGALTMLRGRRASSVLTGDGGHLRCDLEFTRWLAASVGTCQDSDGVLYDLVSQ